MSESAYLIGLLFYRLPAARLPRRVSELLWQREKQSERATELSELHLLHVKLAYLATLFASTSLAVACGPTAEWSGSNGSELGRGNREQPADSNAHRVSGPTDSRSSPGSESAKAILASLGQRFVERESKRPAIERPVATGFQVEGTRLRPVFPEDVVEKCSCHDPTTGTFSAAGSMADTRYNHTATLLGSGHGRVLVVGGSVDGSAALASAKLFHEAGTGTFSLTGPMGTSRCFHQATLLASGKVLIAGGTTKGSVPTSNIPLGSAELYDPTSGTFVGTGSMNNLRGQSHVMVRLASGRGLVTGSGDPPATAASAELYEPATGTFVMAILPASARVRRARRRSRAKASTVSVDRSSTARPVQALRRRMTPCSVIRAVIVGAPARGIASPTSARMADAARRALPLATARPATSARTGAAWAHQRTMDRTALAEANVHRASASMACVAMVRAKENASRASPRRKRAA